MASEGLGGQPLLVPESIAVSQREADCAEEHAEYDELGKEMHNIMENTRRRCKNLSWCPRRHPPKCNLI